MKKLWPYRKIYKFLTALICWYPSKTFCLGFWLLNPYDLNCFEEPIKNFGGFVQINFAETAIQHLGP